jgi:hypothetical protein
VFGRGEEQVPESLLARLGLELVDDGQHGPGAEAFGFLKMPLLVGIDVLLHEGVEPGLERLHFGGWIERHVTICV